MHDLAGARIAFAGTPQFAVPSLTMLIEAGADIPVVLTQPDRPAGRGRKLSPSPVKSLALANGIPVEQPERLDDRRLLDAFAPAPEILLVVAYGLLLPSWVLSWPRVACVNVHASLLPRWRGAAPIQRAIMAGDEQTGVSLMRMGRGLDTGPVYASRSTPIRASDTSADLHTRLGALGAELAGDTLPAIMAGDIEPVPQDEAEHTLAPKLSKAEAPLDWRQAAAVLAHNVHGLNPWPVAEGYLEDGQRVRVFAAEAVAGTGEPGQILRAGAAGVDVATGDGVLRLTEVQLPGGRRIRASDWALSRALQGHRFELSRG